MSCPSRSRQADQPVVSTAENFGVRDHEVVQVVSAVGQSIPLGQPDVGESESAGGSRRVLVVAEPDHHLSQAGESGPTDRRQPRPVTPSPKVEHVSGPASLPPDDRHRHVHPQNLQRGHSIDDDRLRYGWMRCPLGRGPSSPTRNLLPVRPDNRSKRSVTSRPARNREREDGIYSARSGAVLDRIAGDRESARACFRRGDVEHRPPCTDLPASALVVGAALMPSGVAHGRGECLESQVSAATACATSASVL